MDFPETEFKVTNDWVTSFPGASAGVLVVENIQNPQGNPELEARKTALLKQLRQDYGTSDRTDLRQIPTLNAYHEYYKRFKKSYHVQLQLESVAIKGKSIPKVSGLVDAMFMAELQDFLLTAGHDLDLTAPPLILNVAQGNEHYTQITGKDVQLKAGDMFISDANGVISSIIYGPDSRTKITASTKRVVYTTYAPPGVEPAVVSDHLDHILDILKLFSPENQVKLKKVYLA